MQQLPCCTLLAAKFWLTSFFRFRDSFKSDYFWEAARTGQGHFCGEIRTHIFVVETLQTSCAYAFFLVL